MCSFDVCSLFTNVPLDETIQICLDKLYALPDSPAIPRPVLKKLLDFATKKSHFIFDGQYYDQFDGVAMGSPLGPVLANIFMCDFEEKWLTLGRIQDLTKGGSDKRPPKAVTPRGVRGHAPPENF